MLRTTTLSSLLLLVTAVYVFSAATACGQDRLKGFGKEKKPTPIKGFGANAEFWIKHVTEKDKSQAKSWIAKYDKDGNGILESTDTASWGRDSIPLYDLNLDGKMTFRELATAVAKLRVKKEQAAKDKQRKEKVAAAKKAKTDALNAALRVVNPATKDPAYIARLQMCHQLASELIAKQDRNGNKQLESNEWQNARVRYGKFSGGADTNGDDIIVHAELSSWLMRRLPPLGPERLATPLRRLDADRDGQIALSEFAANLDGERVAAFRLLDQNNDGMISPQESFAPPKPPGAIGYSNKSPTVIPNQTSAVSSIFINDDIQIEDLAVRVAITKKSDEQLALFLIGPDKQQITLFAGGWRPWPGPYLFESTLIDDEAPYIDKTLPQPPLPRMLRTDALKKNEPGLRHFYSKSARGTWKLMAVNLNNQVGVLHSWTLWVKPKNEVVGAAVR